MLNGFLIFCILGFVLLRTLVFRKTISSAIDQWYWLAYRKAVLQQRKVPPKLKEYILDVRQWYPPIYGWLLSLIPEQVFKNANSITIILSLIRLSLVYCLILCLGANTTTLITFTTLVYISAPILVYYDNQINPRVFGALLVDFLTLCWLGYFEYNNNTVLIPIVVLSIALLFTHKMSHQLYLFMLLGLSAYYLSIAPICSYIIAVMMGLLFFGYKKYAIAHIEIVRFWSRNKYKLGAHQFYESEIYGVEGYVGSNRLHGNGFNSVIKKTALIIGLLPVTLIAFFNFEPNFFGILIVSTVLLIVLTSYIPYLYCLGSGNLYTYNLLTLICFYVVITPIHYSTILNETLIALVFFMTLTSIAKYYTGLRSNNNPEHLDDAMAFIKAENLNRIMVIPFQLPDEVTYKTNKIVFWGCHGLGFLWAEPYFPVFNRKIEEALKEWNLGGILLQKDYFPEFEMVVDMEILQVVYENERFKVFSIANWKDGEKTPDWATNLYPKLFSQT
jgi:hypothetical protein